MIGHDKGLTRATRVAVQLPRREIFVGTHRKHSAKLFCGPEIDQSSLVHVDSAAEIFGSVREPRSCEGLPPAPPSSPPSALRSASGAVRSKARCETDGKVTEEGQLGESECDAVVCREDIRREPFAVRQLIDHGSVCSVSTA